MGLACSSSMPDDRELLDTILSSCGAEVETADSAEAALAIMQRVTPTDAGYRPRCRRWMDTSCFQRVRALPEPHRNVPAIAVTAHARAERALDAGFQAYVSKPTFGGSCMQSRI
jgi:CheY-like chemotaxis protein